MKEQDEGQMKAKDEEKQRSNAEDCVKTWC